MQNTLFYYVRLQWTKYKEYERRGILNFYKFYSSWNYNWLYQITKKFEIIFVSTKKVNGDSSVHSAYFFKTYKWTDILETDINSQGSPRAFGLGDEEFPTNTREE